MKHKYTAEYFIAKFEPIPEKDWVEGGRSVGEFQQCVLGHCSRKVPWTRPTREKFALSKLLLPITSALIPPRMLDRLDSWSEIVYELNDGLAIGNKMSQLGDTPKERIINALVMVACGLDKEL